MELTKTCGRAAVSCWVSLLSAILLMEEAGGSALELGISSVKQGVAISESPVHGKTMKGGFLGSLAAHGLGGSESATPWGLCRHGGASW